MPTRSDGEGLRGGTKREDGRNRPKSCCPTRGWRNHDVDLSDPDHDWSEGFTTWTPSSRKGNNSFVFIQTIKISSQVNIRGWCYVGTTALEDIILEMDECSVRDTHSVVSSDKFYECIAIIVYQIGDNIFAHAAQNSGHYKGEASDVWDCIRGSGPPLAIPTKSRRSDEFIGYLMNLRGRWMITVLQIIIVWQSYIIYSTWDNDQNLTSTTKDKSQWIFDLNLKLCCWSAFSRSSFNHEATILLRKVSGVSAWVGRWVLGDAASLAVRKRRSSVWIEVRGRSLSGKWSIAASLVVRPHQSHEQELLTSE